MQRLRAIDPLLPTLEKLREIVKVFWEMYSRHLEYQRVVDYCQRPDFQRSVSVETRRVMQAADAGMTEVIHGIIQQGVAGGVLPNRPLPLMLFGAQAALTGAVTLLWIGCLSGPKDPYLDRAHGVHSRRPHASRAFVRAAEETGVIVLHR